MPTHIRLPHNQPTTVNPFASPKQIALLERLIEEREMTDEQASWYIDRIYRHRNTDSPYQITKTEISKWFGKRELGTGLFGRPMKPGYVPDHKAAFVQAPFGRTPDEQDVGEHSITVPPNFTPVRNRVAAEVGVYRHNDKVYVVRKRRRSEYRYATVLVELGLPRLNEHGQTVTHDFVKAYGMEYELSADERITNDEEIKALCIQVGRCIMCSHAIWQAKSVARMMGTRCYKRVHGLIR